MNSLVRFYAEYELLSPTHLKSRLTTSGFTAAELTIEEFFLADDYGTKYIKLSRYDRIALAIAKTDILFF